MVPGSTGRELQVASGERLRDHSVEALSIQDERAHRREGGDGGAPRRGRQQSDLPEMRTWPQRSDVGPAYETGRLSRVDHVEVVRRLALCHERYPRRKRRPPTVLEQLGQARGPQSLERGKFPAARPMPASSVRTREHGSSRPAVGRTCALESSNTSAVVDRPNGCRPAARGQQSHLAERLASLHHSQDLHVTGIRVFLLDGELPVPHHVERRRPVALTEDRLARPDTPERDAARRGRSTSRPAGRRTPAVRRRARRPRCATSISARNTSPRTIARTRRTSARTSWIRPRIAGPARNATSSTSSILEPNPPFHSDDTKPPKIRFQKKYAV